MATNSEKSEREKAYEYALFLLSLRLRSEGEISGKLKLKKYEPKIVEKVVEELKAFGYIDDLRLVETYLENLKKYKTLGFYGIKKKLLEKKFPAKLAENILNENFSLKEEVKIAEKFLDKFRKGLDNLSVSREEKTKLARKMQAKGFRLEVIRLVLGL